MRLSELKLWLKRYLAKALQDQLTGFFQKEFVHQKIVLRYKKTNVDAISPTKAYKDDAGLDLYALSRTYIPAGEWRTVKTGLAFEIPTGWHLQVHTRSSYGKHRMVCHLGIIDSGYRNELLILVFNNGHEDFIIEQGNKFCQLLVLPVPEVELQEVSELSETDRGLGGFGSSGK